MDGCHDMIRESGNTAHFEDAKEDEAALNANVVSTKVVEGVEIMILISG